MKSVFAFLAALLALTGPLLAADDYNICCPQPGHSAYSAYQACLTDGNNAADDKYDDCMAGPPPPPSFTATCVGQTAASCKTSYCGNVADHYRGQWFDYCEGLYCWYVEPSPILIGNPDLVGPADGVDFDIYANGVPVRIGWTRFGANAFLAMDRGGDGILDGRDLFGNQTPQNPLLGEARNGFAALRDLDANNDGELNAGDPAFGRLLLWSDLNQDGLSQPAEMRPAFLELAALEVRYHESRGKDRHGNQFRWRGKAVDLNGHPVRLTDVIFAH